ncbi:MAG TPA: hypothetical protein VKV25_07670, partial [Acidimicrobiales bacterium]|nr:hypothetical protein [Acidimicrobiales bacterium]
MIGLGIPCPAGIVCGAGLGGPVSRGVANAVLNAFADQMSLGAAWLVHHVSGLVLPGTEVDLRQGWFLGREAVMRDLAGAVVLPLVGVATIGAVVRRDWSRLLRIYAVGLPLGLIAGAAAVAFVSWALRVVDGLSRAVAPRGTLLQLAAAVARLVQPGVPAFVQLVVAALVLLGTFVLWLELVVRSTAIYLAVFFFPLALAAVVWPAAVSVAKRFVEVLAVLIGAKFVIVATLSLGAAAVRTGSGLDAAITGAATLLMAAFAPFAVLRLVPLVEVAAVGQLEGLSRRPGRAVAAAEAGVTRIGAGPVGGLVARLGEGDPGGLT